MMQRHSFHLISFTSKASKDALHQGEFKKIKDKIVIEHKRDTNKKKMSHTPTHTHTKPLISMLLL